MSQGVSWPARGLSFETSPESGAHDWTRFRCSGSEGSREPDSGGPCPIRWTESGPPYSASWSESGGIASNSEPWAPIFERVFRLIKICAGHGGSTPQSRLPRNVIDPLRQRARFEM